MNRMSRKHAWMMALALAGAMTAQAQPQELQRDGYALKAHVQGAGPVTVLFEAGFGQTADAWDKVIADLGGSCRCVAYSRAGLGGSGTDGEAMSIGEHVQDLAAVVEAFADDRPVVLVGHSYGGLLATEFARQYPQRLLGLVLVDPTTMGQRHAQRAVDRKRVGEDDSMLLGMLPPAMAADYRRLVSQLDDPAAATPRELPALPVMLLTATQVAEEPFVFEETAAGKVVWKREHAALFAAAVRGSHRYVDSGHNIHRERPGLVADAIREVAAAAPRPAGD
jgi:pimeloyl-ACP methyl ester carboxylesterase